MMPRTAIPAPLRLTAHLSPAVPPGSAPRSASTLGFCGLHGAPRKEGGSGSRERREGQTAARAGTRGFRAPEVLLKCPNQSTAIDVWSAGVILLTVLSGVTPFFLSNEDSDAMAELGELFGDDALAAAAARLGKEYVRRTRGPAHAPAPRGPAGLRRTCELLSGELNKAGVRRRAVEVPDAMFDLLDSCFALHPADRITAVSSVARSVRAPRPTNPSRRPMPFNTQR